MTTTAIAPAAASATVEADFTSLQDLLGYLTSYRVGDFYARLVASLPSRADKRVPFMGVCWERGHHVLLYNPDWVDKKLQEGRKGFNEIRATVAHEAMHIVLCHIARQMRLYRCFGDEDTQKKFLQRSNVAADMAVNDLLLEEKDEKTGTYAYPDLHENPKEWVLPANMGFPSNLTYEWYLSLIMDKNICPKCVIKLAMGEKKKDGEKGEGQGQKGPKGDEKCEHGGQDGDPQQGKHSGAHEFWVEFAADATDEEIEMAATQIEQEAYEKIKQAVAEHKRDRGTVPGFVEQKLEDMLKPPRVPWKRLLHQFVSRCRHSKPVRTLSRPRKRWVNLGTTLYPGVRRDPTFRLYFAIDTSGSMSDKDILDGLSELQGIQKLDRDIEVVVVEFDTMIHKEYLLDARGEVQVNVKGRGGTDFNKAFERAVELSKKSDIDAMIVFTDGYAPAPEVTCRPQHIPLMWCLTDGGVHPSPGYGFEIRRPDTKRV